MEGAKFNFSFSRVRLRTSLPVRANDLPPFSRVEEDDLGLVLFMAQKMAKRKAV